MVSNFFSRAKQAPEPVSATSAEAAETAVTFSVEKEVFASALSQWQTQLRELTRVDLGSLPARLKITGAHPSGLAQLYAERNTRIASLIRDPQKLSRAEEIARKIYSGSLDTATSRGVSAIHVGWGLATWTSDEGTVESPLLLRPVQLSFESTGEAAIMLVGEIQIAAAILEAVRLQGRELNEAKIVALTKSRAGFAPEPALNSLKSALAQVLPNFKYSDFVEVAQFLHPAQSLVAEFDHPEAFAQSPLVRGLAGEAKILQLLPEGAPEPNPFDRDPDTEIGIGDQLPEQLDNVEAISTGLNALLDTSGGADPTATVASVLTAAAVNGKSSLYLSADRRRLVQLWEYLSMQGLGHAVARVDASASAAPALLESLQAVYAPHQPQPDLEQVKADRDKLREVRSALENYTADLHEPYPAWGVSAYDALQVLTDLMSARPGPATRVRLSAETLTKLADDTDEIASGALLEAAEAGMFQASGAVDAWFGAVISAPEQVAPVLERIRTLVLEKLPPLRVNMSTTAAQTGLTPAGSFVEWEEQLRMLDGIREALDVFQPIIFERSVADMVIATASNQWRRDHGAEMKRSQRSRLTKQAKDMLRPGRYVADLHAELVKVQKQRDVWRRHCDAGGWPKIPANLDEMLREVAEVKAILEKLNPTLATAHGNLTRMDVTELSLLLKRLAQDPAGAAQIPSRLQILKKLHGFGLEAFVKDLRNRCVPTTLIERELELAWWASALGVMLENIPGLGGFDSAKLQNLVADFRRLDSLQVKSLAGLASAKIRENRRQVSVKFADEEAQVRQALSQDLITEANVTKIFGGSQLVRDLFPIAFSSVALVPTFYTLQDKVDLLIVDSATDLPLFELIPLFARAKQVVVTADCSLQSETLTALQTVFTQLNVMPQALRVNGHVSQLCARYNVRHALQPVPVPRLGSKLSISFADGRGMPAPDANCIESTAAEVEAVVDLILDHGLMNPERSLAVVAPTRVHAQRIRERLKSLVNSSPALADFFRADQAEPFTILHPEVLNGQQRDKVIFALGYAKTPHGRVLHNFGEISRAGGENQLASLLSVARDELHIVSSVKPEEFDRSRFSVPGALMLLDLLSMAMDATVSDSQEWPVMEVAPDQLLIDLAERLYKVGLQVIPNIGGEGALRVPLAVGHPYLPGELLVAISTDDAVYVSEPSLRRRDRYWPELLETHGWKTRTELSLAVFIDPQKEADAVVELVLDAVDERLAHDPELAALFAAEVGVDNAADTEAAAVEVLPEEPERVVDTVVEPVEVSVSAVSEELIPVVSDPVVERAAVADRGVRPEVARGLSLSAYADEQLDELANWIRSDQVIRSEAEMLEALAWELQLSQTGPQVEAVLRNVIRRTGGVSGE